MKQSASSRNVVLLASVPTLFTVLFFAGQLNEELSPLSLLARVGTLNVLGLLVLAMMPLEVGRLELHKLFRWLYLPALLPFALYYLWLPGYLGGFPMPEFFVGYGVQLTYTLVLVTGVVSAWRLPQIWQRWSLTAAILIGGGLFSSVLASLLP